MTIDSLKWWGLLAAVLYSLALALAYGTAAAHGHGHPIECSECGTDAECEALCPEE